MLEETSNRRAGYINADVDGDKADELAPTTWLQKTLAGIEGEVARQEQQVDAPEA